MEELKARIDSWYDFSSTSFNDLVRSVEKLENSEEIDELFNLLISRTHNLLKDYVINNDLASDGVHVAFADIRNIMLESDVLEEEYVDGLLSDYGLVSDSPFSREIASIEEDLKDVREEVKANRNSNALTDEEIQQINEQIDALKEEQKEIYERSNGDPSDEDEIRFHEINEQVNSLESRLANNSNSNNDVEVTDEELEIYLREQIEVIESDKSNGVKEINEQISEINNYIVTRNAANEVLNIVEEIKKNPEYNSIFSKIEPLYDENDELLGKISKLDKEANSIDINAGDDAKRKYMDLISEAQSYRNIVNRNKKNIKQMVMFNFELSELLSKLEKNKELFDKNANFDSKKYQKFSDEELNAMIEELDKKSKDIQSEADKKISNYKSKLEKLQELKKLKAIDSRERIEKVEDKKQNKALWGKALAGVAGFAVGLGMSAVPGVGTIRMVAAGTKLVVSGVNVWTKKHPEGKVAKVVDAGKAKFEGLTAKFSEKFPKISSGVHNVKEKIKKVVVNEKFNWFVNGVSIGYIAGNMIELATGKTWIENLKPNGSDISNVPSTPSSSVSNPGVPVSLASDGFQVGDTLDVSSITEGFVDSYGTSQANLMTELGKNVKIVGESNGMYSLQSLVDGELYAWLPKDAVDALKAGVSVVGKSK